MSSVGHGIYSKPDDRSGEGILDKELFSFYVQNGIEEAVADVFGAYTRLSSRRAGFGR